MLMLYFSGTGNSKYIAELFSRTMGASCHSIEEDINFDMLISADETICFCYPIYASRVPRIMREFVVKHTEQLKGKKLIIFCTQMIFSGDGARVLTDLFPRDHMQVVYAEHFYMPNNVTNVVILPDWLISDGMMTKLTTKAQRKMQAVCSDIQSGKVKKRGFCFGSRMLGLMQAWALLPMERRANKSVKISEACNTCGLCTSNCPMKNFTIESDTITHTHNCTVCYRCVNECPKKAITVAYHGKVNKQFKGVEL